MPKIKEYSLVLILGASTYSLLEILWRGYTHWTMSITGGVCFLCIYIINKRLFSAKLWQKCLLGAVIITTIEFMAGCIVNLFLHWNVWDYSHLKIEFLGQVSLLFFIFWYFLCYPAIYLSSYLQKKISAPLPIGSEIKNSFTFNLQTSHPMVQKVAKTDKNRSSLFHTVKKISSFPVGIGWENLRQHKTG